jgi:hypothetical protein
VSEPTGNFPHGICPFQSGQPVPVPTKSKLAQPGAVEIGFAEVGCAGDRCQLWDKRGPGCALKIAPILDAGLDNITEDINELTGQFTPPKGAPSPIMRLAQAVEKLVDLTERRMSEGGAPQKT